MLTCSRCSRANPPEAQFCYHDGAALGGGAHRAGGADPARRRFPMPFVFPSGKACNSFDELVLAALGDWKGAAELLSHGVFANFFAGMGRADLSLAAREAAKFPDRDRGLDQLLGRLPAQVLQPARLAVEPGQLNLGSMRVGQDGRFDLRLANQGMGLLHGTINCEECPWLSLGERGAGAHKKLFQFLHEADVAVNVIGKSLRAGNKPHEGKIVIDSCGGTFVVAVRVDVPVQAFADGVLAGALTPRQVAEKAKKHPREAADLFARGAVARWYEANGWIYPVKEPSASGVAAVQQFFEALGLTTPPKVGINVADIRLEARAGAVVRASVQVVAQEKRPVYAHATSDQPWLKVNDVAMDGRTATVNLRVPETPHRPGETLLARVTITANGRQRFVVPVLLTVTGPAAPATGRFRPPGPVETVRLAGETRRDRDRDREEVLDVVVVEDDLPPPPPPPPPRRRDRERYAEDDRAEARPAQGKGGGGLAALPVAFLVLALLVVFCRDVVAWVRTAVVAPPVAEANVPEGEQVLALEYHDQELQGTLVERGGMKPGGAAPGGRKTLVVWEPSMRFGLFMRNPDAGGENKRLTFKKNGLTNNCCVKLDNTESLFGERPFRLPNGKYVVNNWPGRWLDRNAKLDRPLRDGRRSVWLYEPQQVHVTQTVGLAPGAQSGKLDTCLVHYRIENKDQFPHSVGLRFLLDTYIGGNDGVPFLIPGVQQLVSTQTEFFGAAQIPDFIQAREREDLANPGTIAQVQLKIPGMEPPSRVTLGAWPNPALGGKCRQEKTMWDVPVLPIKTIPPGDSAVTIYWDEKVIPAGGAREMAFAYGLGNVSAGEGGGRLALTVGGSFVPGGEFTLTAYVNNPGLGQTVTLELPEGFELAAGQPTEAVPPPAGGGSQTIPVTWKVRAGPREGKFELRVKSSTGAAQTQPVRIKVRGIFGS
jgi:hypothetical protein